tara:strand:- start:534 stop:1517 length:984 start_codon:yes stop_codon:yes gene_type:complete
VKLNNIILGCQTFGSSLNPNECDKVVNLCIKNGIVKFDLAESYPFPENDKTFGISEKIFGNWITKNKKLRKKIIISTKVTGRNNNKFKSLSSERVTPNRIIKSAEKSLKRLKTSYIDTYYLHWPDRYTNIFGRTFYNPDKDPHFIPIEDQFEAFYKLKKSGKIIDYGICNETSWGVMKFLEISKKKNMKPTLQEEYSIINRNIEKSLKEIVIREKLNINIYSPLSGGLLTGKYIFNSNAQGRLNRFKMKTSRNQSPIKIGMVKNLNKICKKNNIKMMDFSYNFLKKQKFVSNIIFGISKIQQLEKFLKSWNVNIDDRIYRKILKEIN